MYNCLIPFLISTGKYKFSSFMYFFLLKFNDLWLYQIQSLDVPIIILFLSFSFPFSNWIESPADFKLPLVRRRFRCLCSSAASGFLESFLESWRKQLLYAFWISEELSFEFSDPISPFLVSLFLPQSRHQGLFQWFLKQPSLVRCLITLLQCCIVFALQMALYPLGTTYFGDVTTYVT